MVTAFSSVRRLTLIVLVCLAVNVGGASAQPFAYVLGQRDDPATPENRGIQVVHVINTATNTRLTSVDAGLGCQCIAPNAMTISRDGSELYVANEIADTVTVMSTVTNTVAATLDIAVVGNGPNALAVSADNTRLYVLSDSAGATVSVVDRASRTRVTTIPLGVAQARGMAVNPDGSRLYISTYGSNSIKVISTATNTVVATVLVGSLPVGLDVSRDGRAVYAAAFSSNTVSVVNASSNSLTTNLAVGLRPRDVGVSPDGSRTYSVNTGTLSIIDPAGSTVIGTVTGLLNPSSIDFTPDSGRAYVAAFSAVYAVDTATDSVIATLPLASATDGIGASVVVTPPPFVPPVNPPPTGLYAASVVANQVTLRWTPPAGSSSTGYLIEGGINPGEVLASLANGGASPIFQFVAPSGAFHVRVHALTALGRSPASNEIRLFVNTPTAPSAPTALLGMVNGSDVALTWKNTYLGGAATSSVVDVTGAFTGSLPLGPGESFSFTGVPAGNYTLALRSVNASGVSTASNSISLNVPGSCSGAPSVPTNFIATVAGSTVTLLWDPPATGAAPTGYVVRVAGSFVGQIPTAQRTVSGVVGSGTYHLSVVAANPCGQSPETPVHTVTIP